MGVRHKQEVPQTDLHADIYRCSGFSLNPNYLSSQICSFQIRSEGALAPLYPLFFLFPCVQETTKLKFLDFHTEKLSISVEYG